MLKALLIDDEINNLENLAFLLENDCEGIVVVGKVTSASLASEILSKKEIDIIFLDIQMPKINGFQFLETLGNHNYKIIFITAYNEYAIKAIKAGAYDYILKPIDLVELQTAINKLQVTVSIEEKGKKEQVAIQRIVEQLNPKQYPKRLGLHQLGSICFVEVEQIISLEADSNYTIIHLSNMQKMVFSKTLKDFEEQLDPKQFARIHKSYIVNLQHVKEYKTTDGGVVRMSDGNCWSISRRQLDSFLLKMQ